MTTVLENVVTGLKTAGYKVNLTPQEVMKTKELVITLDKVDMETETATSYFMTSTYGVHFVSESVAEIATMIPAIVIIIDKAAVGTMRDFQSVTPELNKQDGTMYLVTMKFAFKEIINIV